MLGLITSLSHVVHTIAQSGHKNASNSAHKKATELTPDQIKEKKLSRLAELKFKSAYEVSLMKNRSKVFYAPPHSTTENPGNHKIIYMAYEWGENKIGQDSVSNFVFPFPSGINDSVTTEWDDETSMMKRMTAALFGKGDKNVVEQGVEEFKGVVDGAMAGIDRRVAKFNQGDFYFQKVNKREFSFSHKMTPQSEKESEEMGQLVDWLLFHSSPSKSSANQLISPAEWDIHFMSKGVDNPFLPKIGRCILETVTINNTPNDNFQPSENSYPNDVDIELNFKEIGVRTKDDITLRARGI